MTGNKKQRIDNYKIISLLLIICIFTYEVSAQTVSPSTTENFIHVIEPVNANATADGQTSGVHTVQYIDGLGRPKQVINVKASGNGKDVVTKVEYDDFGREEKNYLPIPSSSQTNGAYIPTINGTFYQDNYGESVWYSQKTFENSPLNRVMAQVAPGDDWQKGGGHEVELQYLTNTATEVKRFKVALSGNYEPTLVRDGNHDANQLYKTIVKNENGISTINYKNKLGQVVLKRTSVTTYIAASRDTGPIDINGVVQNADTYYVYDIYGNLTYIIPPLASVKSTITADILKDLCYTYRYDQRDRLVEKKLPGKGKEYLVYDKQDRLVASQDEVMKPQSQWAYIKYDKFGRVAYTGLVWDPASRENLQNSINTTFGSNNTEYDATGFVQDNMTFYYKSGQGYPTGTSHHILTVNYYDQYPPSRVSDGANFPSLPGVDIREGTNAVNESLKGLPTATVTRIMGTWNFEKTYVYYDIKSRPVWTHKINHLGGYTKVQNNLDFRGKPTSTITFHKYNSSTPSELKVQDNFNYDTQERLISHNQIINNGVAQRIANNSYDEIGQLTYKLVGNNNSHPALQGIDYTYNIRGWLSGINNIEENMQLRGLPGEPMDDIFSFKIQYNDLIYGGESVAEKLYNGNISQTYWRTASDNIIRGYSYDYDQLNRLKFARFNKVTGTNPPTGFYPGSFDESMAYDLNGNIKHLIRHTEDANGAKTDMDDLQYTYKVGNGNSNQLAKVADVSNATAGFRDGTNLDDDYNYDLNGNMTLDKNKGIASITYNHLNLPTVITWSGSTPKKIEYLYNAAGVKVQKKVTNGSMVHTTNYLDGFQYFNGVLQFFPHAEGYVKQTTVNNQMTFDYVFNYTDHLGNIRLSYAKDPATGDLKIMEENHYYPFGLKHKKYAVVPKAIISNATQTDKALVDVDPSNPVQNIYSNYDYKFQGQERQDELGLNWDSFKWRNYDPAIARFMSVDPLATSYTDWGPYVFSGNRVIDARELEGLEPEILNGEELGYGDMADLFGPVELESEPIVKFMPEKYHEGYDSDAEIMSSITGHIPLQYALDSWVKDHFEISGGGELSFGLQAGGGFKKGAAAHVDFGSLVISDFNISNKKERLSSYDAPQDWDDWEKFNRGIGVAYYGGVEYKRQTYNGISTNDIAIGVLGFGGNITLDDDGNLTDWFWGFDPSFQAEFGIGLELNFRIGFSK